MKVFFWKGYFYGLAKFGILYRSIDGVTPFEKRSDVLFRSHIRHTGVLLCDSILFIFVSRIGDSPESILVSWIDLGLMDEQQIPWEKWQASPLRSLSSPRENQGVKLKPSPSKSGPAFHPTNQLRDPAVFVESCEEIYMIYSIYGEFGLVIDRLVLGRDFFFGNMSVNETNKNVEDGFVAMIEDINEVTTTTPTTMPLPSVPPTPTTTLPPSVPPTPTTTPPSSTTTPTSTTPPPIIADNNSTIFDELNTTNEKIYISKTTNQTREIKNQTSVTRNETKRETVKCSADGFENIFGN